MAIEFSYAKFEKEFIHDLRLKISHAEDIADVINGFSHVAGAFLRKIIDGEFDLYDDDIIFDSSVEGKYKFSDRLLENKFFLGLIEESDILNIISKFAETADHRYTHLSKHPLKSDLKIRR
jgi:hypothetical protein